MKRTRTIDPMGVFLALLAVIVIVIIVFAVVPDGTLSEKEYISAKEDYTTAMANYTSSLEDPETAIDPAKVAHEILREAGIDHDAAFISSVNSAKQRIRIYYMDQPYPDYTIYRYIDIALSKAYVAPDHFITGYFTTNAFCKGYGYAIEWEYDELNSYTLMARLAPDDEVVESKSENYDIMRARELVETDCGLVDLLRESLPFKINKGDCFFCLDKTRTVGWFYFRSTYNKVDFVGCYEVRGWEWNATYEELMNADGYNVVSINKTRIYIGIEQRNS